MIETFYENPNKVYRIIPPTEPYSHGGHYYSGLASKKGVTLAEYHRRNNIIVTKARECRVWAGTTVWPVSKENYDIYGECHVRGVVRTYADFNEEWPASDNPFIVSAYSTVTKKEVFATNNFFQHMKPTTYDLC